MKNITCFLLLLIGLVSPFLSSAATVLEDYQLESPDGRIKVSIKFPGPDSVERPHWSARFLGMQVLTNCSLGLQIANEGELIKGVRLQRERRRSVSKRIPVLFGKAAYASDHFNEMRFQLESLSHRKVDVIFRCYNDAIALRYELPQNKAGLVTITDETTSFGVSGDPTAYVQYLENYTTSHEHNVVPTPVGGITNGVLLDLPLTLSWSSGAVAAITEASLRHYAGMSLKRSKTEGSPVQLVCDLTPTPDGTKVVRPVPLLTPWRVVLLGERPGTLLESQTLYCLNAPSLIGNVSWIKPGKITFSWWNGDVYDGKRGAPILSLETAKKYIDFCARNGIPTHSLTSDETVTPWYYQSKPGTDPGPDTDVTRPRAEFDLASIRQYAKSKNVRLWTWVHQGALRGRVEQAFAAFEKLGWSGMMVDFFDHDDQESIEFAEQILQAAARHHILIHFHGVWKPTGWQRSYPNLMNHEGALNLEYLKWSDLCTPEHNLMMAFTRLIAGPMDYHLGGFRAVPRGEFKPRNIAPYVLGTRCHHLAMYVCYDNPNPMIADYPTAYEGQPGFDFLKIVPTWWDETRVLNGEIGKLLVTARRKGTTWYVGGMSAGNGRNLELPLSFLPRGKFVSNIWKDALDVETDPNHLIAEASEVSSQDTLKLRIAGDGGFVIKITPVP